MWVDAHCHLQLELGEARFSPDDADAQITRARDAGVEWMVCVGTGLETSQQAIDLAARYHDVYATVGLHPHDAPQLDAEWDVLRRIRWRPPSGVSRSARPVSTCTTSIRRMPSKTARSAARCNSRTRSTGR